jgi:chromosomal replication initiator protein
LSHFKKLAFDCWLRETHLIERTDSTLIIEAPNNQAKEWLENRLHETIMRTVSNITGQSLEIEYNLPNSKISKTG